MGGGGYFNSLGEEEFTTEAPRHGEGETLGLVTRETVEVTPQLSLIGQEHEGSNPSPSVPQCLRGESIPFGHPPIASHQPETPMASRVIQPGERDLITRLVSLGVAAAQATVRHSFRAGYSPEQITAILDWYEGHGLADPSNPGQMVYPYAPGQLVRRLQDPYGIVDRHRNPLDPALGNWFGGKYGVWTSLKAQQVAAEKLGQPVAVPPKPAALVALEAPLRAPEGNGDSNAELDRRIDALSHAEALDLLEPGSIVRTVAQRKWFEGQPMPGMVRTAIRKRLIAGG